jgi:hypothetical protein
MGKRKEEGEVVEEERKKEREEGGRAIYRGTWLWRMSWIRRDL